MTLYLLDMIEKTKTHVGADRTRSRIGNDIVLEYIQDAVALVCGKILTQRSDFFLAYADISVTGAREYDLPLGVNRISAVEDITAGSGDPRDTEPLRFEDRFTWISTLDSRVKYYLRHGKLGLPSKMASGTLRVYYPKAPTSLFYAGVTSSTATTITFTSATQGNITPEDDFYNGMFLATSDGQFREITDFVGSTLTATVGSTWGSTPSASDVLSLAIPLSPQFQGIIHMLAGINWRTDLDLPTAELERDYNRLGEPLWELLQKQQTQRSGRVKKVRR